MICPHCHSEAKSRVLETRLTADTISRRRECGSCAKTFTTEEVVREVQLADERSHKFFARKTPEKVVEKNLTLEGVWR